MFSVSVIIVNWNSGELLSKCLNHLQSQTVRSEFVFILDNNSSDNSFNIVHENFPHKKIKVVENIGFAAGNNKVLFECNSDFVALINPDAFVSLDWIKQMINAAKKYPDAAAFGSRLLSHEDPYILDGIGDNYHLSGLVWRNRHGKRQQSQDKNTREIFSPCAAAAMYRRQALVDVGGFDEDYFCYVEDVDLGFRLRLAGYKAMYVPDAVVHHVGSATTGGQHSDFAVYHGHRNLVWTYVKNMPGALFWFLLPLHLLLNLITIGWFVLRGQGLVILKAKRDAIRGLPLAWMKRKKIQTQRVAGIRNIWQALDKRILPNKKWVGVSSKN